MVINNKIDFFAGIFNEVSWKKYCDNFLDTVVPLDLLEELPIDILQPLVYMLGDEYTYKWIKMEIKAIDNFTPIELSCSDKGIKALKAFIMRMPN